jgi:hypothetical protein
MAGRFERANLEWTVAQDMLLAHQRGCRDCRSVGQKDIQYQSVTITSSGSTVRTVEKSVCSLEFDVLIVSKGYSFMMLLRKPSPNIHA